MPCFCIEEVDIEVFVGVFAKQWLHGVVYRPQDPVFFCTTCGSPAVQEALRDADRRSGKGGGKASGSPTSGKEKSKFSFSKLFSKGFSSSKKDLTTAAAGGGSTTNHSFFSTSNDGGASASSTPGIPGAHGKGVSAEEAMPVTPRTESELFLCVTCGACYCKSHASDHHYSRRQPDDASWCGGGNVVGSESKQPLQGYPHHSVFIGVPSYISTRLSSLTEETPWGLLLPTVLMEEVDSKVLDLSKKYQFFDNPEALLDELMARDGNPLLNGSHGASGGGGRSRRDSSLYATSSHHPLGSGSGAMPSDRFLETTSPSATTSSTPLKLGNSPSHVPDHTGNGNGDAGEEAVPLPSQGLVYVSQGSERWSYMYWCARCGTRPVRVSARHYDDNNSRQRHLRRLGQTLAILSYLCHRGVLLELPPKFVAWKAADDAALRHRLRQQQQSFSAVEKRAVKSTEKVEFTATAGAASRAGEGQSAVTVGAKGNGDSACGGSSTAETVDLTRVEVDGVLARACISGYANPSFLCYLNAVLQCVLRCTFFTRPLASTPRNAYPGKLTKSLGLLLHQLRQQTYEDVRNGAVYPYVKAVHQNLCCVSSLFELDEQQDAQELLLTMLNGVADEFDKGRTAEEKMRMQRISFEGSLRSEVVCLHCHHRVPRDEMFMSLSIPIKSSIEEGLRSVFTPCYLRGKDRYACEHCFTKLSPQRQAEHNAEARQLVENQKRLRAEGKKAARTSEDPAKHKTENCLYQEAEVRTSITRLGGTLAIHLLRFHYDAGQQDFVKVASPVSIPLVIDLTPFVSTEVLEAYSTARSMRTLRARFPAVAEEAVLLDYLCKAGGDQELATRRLLVDGHGVDDHLESSVNGDVTSTTPTPSSTAALLPPPLAPFAPPTTTAGGKAAPRKQGTAGVGGGTHPRPLQQSALQQSKEVPGKPSSKVGNGTTPGHRRSLASSHTGSSNSIKKQNHNPIHRNGNAADGSRGGEHERRASTQQNEFHGEGTAASDDESVASAMPSWWAEGGDGGTAGTLTINTAAGSLNSPTACGAAAPSEIPLATRGRRSILGPGVSTHPTATAPTAMLTPQQIVKLKTSDFDPLGERCAPFVGCGAGDSRAASCGAKGLGRTPSLTRRLVGIVTHRGSLHGGHYIAYVRYLGRPEVWFRCDDEDVDIVTEKAVLACAAEVYLAFYE